jgi:glycosyltransferase involved in cell wall biosynthesis
MRAMRILLALPSFHSRGGVHRSGWRVGRSLERAGHEVSICAPDQALFPGDVRVDGATYRFAPGPPDPLQSFTDHLLAATSRYAPEVLLGYYGTAAGFCAVTAGALASVPTVVALRGNDVDLDFFRESKTALLSFAVRRATRVACVSREMARKVEALFERPATFVTNAVDTKSFRTDRAAAAALRSRLGLDARPVIALFGVLKEKRGLDMMARLTLEGALEGWQLLVVGELRAGTVAPPHARVIPWLETTEDLRAAYGIADVVAQPSHHDGMPNVVLEAMACERVVVASPVGGMPDILRHRENGFLCRTTDEWIATLAELRDAPRPDIGAAARASVPTVADECRAIETLLYDAIRSYADKSATR